MFPSLNWILVIQVSLPYISIIIIIIITIIIKLLIHVNETVAT